MNSKSDDSPWQEQLKNSIKTTKELLKYIDLTDKEIEEIKKVTEVYGSIPNLNFCKIFKSSIFLPSIYNLFKNPLNFLT